MQPRWCTGNHLVGPPIHQVAADSVAFDTPIRNSCSKWMVREAKKRGTRCVVGKREVTRCVSFIISVFKRRRRRRGVQAAAKSRGCTVCTSGVVVGVLQGRARYHSQNE
jgi:hypothetical protein